jgi:hypothetical protein
LEKYLESKSTDNYSKTSWLSDFSTGTTLANLRQDGKTLGGNTVANQSGNEIKQKSTALLQTLVDIRSQPETESEFPD